VLEEWQGRITPAVALIALGSNDVGDPRLERRLVALRAITRAPRVTWLAPYNRTAALIVTKVAHRFGDKVIPLAQLPTRDGVHPTSYRPIAGLLGWKLLSEIRKDVSAEPPGAWPPEASSVPVRRAVVLQMQ
jgi:lysophospholipase L1-like esterase